MREKLCYFHFCWKQYAGCSRTQQIGGPGSSVLLSLQCDLGSNLSPKCLFCHCPVTPTTHLVFCSLVGDIVYSPEFPASTATEKITSNYQSLAPQHNQQSTNKPIQSPSHLYHPFKKQKTTTKTQDSTYKNFLLFVFTSVHLIENNFYSLERS